MKNFNILKGVFPNNMARIANQVISVCAWLTNFLLPFVPSPMEKQTDSDISTDDEHISDIDDD